MYRDELSSHCQSVPTPAFTSICWVLRARLEGETQGGGEALTQRSKEEGLGYCLGEEGRVSKGKVSPPRCRASDTDAAGRARGETPRPICPWVVETAQEGFTGRGENLAMSSILVPNHPLTEQGSRCGGRE